MVVSKSNKAPKSAVGARKTKAERDMFTASNDEEALEEVMELEEPTPEPVQKDKRTFHLDREVVLLLGKIQSDIWQETEKKPNLSDLVGEGIRLLAADRGVTAASK